MKLINRNLSGSCRERKIGILLLSIFEKLCWFNRSFYRRHECDNRNNFFGLLYNIFIVYIIYWGCFFYAKCKYKKKSTCISRIRIYCIFTFSLDIYCMHNFYWIWLWINNSYCAMGIKVDTLFYNKYNIAVCNVLFFLEKK